MISHGRTPSERHWRNRAGRTQTAQRNKKLEPRTERTKKGRAGAPCTQASACGHGDQYKAEGRQRLEWHGETAKLFGD
jgi:hypothetical protein